MASEPVVRLTEKEYLEIERSAQIRYEFLDGEIFAMSGGTMAHARLQGNIYYELRNRLAGTPCEPFGADYRVRVSSAVSTYPDVSVVCGEVKPADDRDDSYTNPSVIFEVLSSTTEMYDRGKKFYFYRTIESLKDYILVDQQSVGVEQFTRNADNRWVLREYRSLDDELLLESLGISIPLRLIYERVEVRDK